MHTQASNQRYTTPTYQAEHIEVSMEMYRSLEKLTVDWAFANDWKESPSCSHKAKERSTQRNNQFNGQALYKNAHGKWINWKWKTIEEWEHMFLDLENWTTKATDVLMQTCIALISIARFFLNIVYPICA